MKLVYLLASAGYPYELSSGRDVVEKGALSLNLLVFDDGVPCFHVTGNVHLELVDDGAPHGKAHLLEKTLLSKIEVHASLFPLPNVLLVALTLVLAVVALLPIFHSFAVNLMQQLHFLNWYQRTLCESESKAGLGREAGPHREFTHGVKVVSVYSLQTEIILIALILIDECLIIILGWNHRLLLVLNILNSIVIIAALTDELLFEVHDLLLELETHVIHCFLQLADGLVLLLCQFLQVQIVLLLENIVVQVLQPAAFFGRLQFVMRLVQANLQLLDLVLLSLHHL